MTTVGIRLSELAGKVKGILDGAFAGVSFWVVGDVTNHTFRGVNGTHYFDLVEKDPKGNGLLARFNCSSWGNASFNIVRFEKITGQKFQNNIQVLVCVKVKFHAQYGLQLDLLDVNPNYTLGLLERKRQETLESLLKNNPSFVKQVGERLVTYNQGLTFNLVLQKIAVISSYSSAGLQDFMHTLENNVYEHKYDVNVFDTEVQGESFYKGLVNRLKEIQSSGKNYDLIAIIRGGGAQTDFLIFDNYYVAAEVAKFPIPVITGIGHQKNETIVDLMAHTSTKTPTKVAEFIIAHNKHFEERVLSIKQTIIFMSQQILNKKHKELDGCRNVLVNGSKSLLHRNSKTLNSIFSKVVTHPFVLLNKRGSEVWNLSQRVISGTKNLFENKRKDVDHLKALIRVMSPESILNKGFAIVKKDGRIITDPNLLGKGDELEIVLGEKEIVGEVKSIKHFNH